MSKVYNFSAGPACMPEWVLKTAADEMLDARGSGMSVMEMSHRSKAFESILQETKDTIRRLASIPEDYEILFLQGGGNLQFSMVPMNFNKNGADIINTGQWTKKAIAEAKKLGRVHLAGDSSDKTFTYIPKITGKIWIRIQTTSTSAKTTPSTEQSTKICRLMKASV